VHAGPARTTRQKLNRMRYHATGQKAKGGIQKGARRSELYGTGISGRTVRREQARKRLLEAQKEYEKFIKEKRKRSKPVPQAAPS